MSFSWYIVLLLHSHTCFSSEELNSETWLFPICSTVMEHQMHLQMHISSIFEGHAGHQVKTRESKTNKKSLSFSQTLGFKRVFQMNNMPCLCFILCY